MLAQPHRAAQRERMARAGLFLGRSDNPHVIGKLPRDLFEHFEPGGVDAIIVGEENAHQAGTSAVSPPI